MLYHYCVKIISENNLFIHPMSLMTAMELKRRRLSAQTEEKKISADLSNISKIKNYVPTKVKTIMEVSNKPSLDTPVSDDTIFKKIGLIFDFRIKDNEKSEIKSDDFEPGIVTKETSIDQFPRSNILRNSIEIECNFPVSISTSKFIDTG